MKRILIKIIALLLLCFTLTACGISDAEDKTQTEDTKYFMCARVPDTIKYKSKEVKKYFYSEGERYAFEPSESYGKIVPYLYSQKEYITADGDEYECNMYGIATFDGKIITAGIYCGIYEMTSKDGTTVFVCEKTCTEEGRVQKDIITQDGSVLMEADFDIKSENSVMHFSAMPCECFTVPSKDGVLLYDFKGRLITNLTEAFGADCCFSVYYCDGEKIIFTAAPTAHTDKPQELDFYCMSKQGELAYTLNFDGYFPAGFEGGRFILVNGEGKAKLADVMGNIITGSKTYNSIIYDFKNKGYWCCDRKGNITKTDENAEKLFGASAKKIDNPELNLLVSSDSSSLFVKSADKSTDFVWISGESGEKLKIDKKGLVDIELIVDGKNDYVKALYDGYADFYNATGTYLKTIKDFKEFKGSCGGKILYLDDENCLCINGLNVTRSFKLQLSQKQAESYNIAYFDGEALAISFLSEGKTLTAVYDISAEKVIIENMSDFCLINSGKNIFYIGKTDGKFVLINESANTLISLVDKRSL